ncbi:UNVERIFIED_CONTAM: hypothetical protein K2H54_004871 [Gekko kuhli]
MIWILVVHRRYKPRSQIKEANVIAIPNIISVSGLTPSTLLQVLTLASNERIPLNPTMRLLFEISHLRTATPATVSRAGSWQMEKEY